MTEAIGRSNSLPGWLSGLLKKAKAQRDLQPASSASVGAAADGRQVSTAGNAARKVGELSLFPPREKWDDWQEWDAKAWPKKVPRRYMLVPTVCFNCEAACGLVAYVDKETLEVRKFEGNPDHPGSRGRNCAKGPATLNQVNDPDRI